MTELVMRYRVADRLQSVVQLLENFPTFYGNLRFITVFTTALHLSLY
jgi:hypothetical protein